VVQQSATILAKELLPAETRIVMDKVFVGDQSKTFHRWGNEGEYVGYNPHFNTVQIGISLREKHRKAVVEFLGALVRGFNDTFSA